MANIFDKFLNSMRLYDEDDIEDDAEYLDDEEEEEEEPVKPQRRPVPQASPEPEEASVRPQRTVAARRSTAAAPSTVRRSTGSVMEVSMVKPTSMEDARDICEMLLSGRAVVINMEGVQVELAQRIIDFASGACYSIDGNLQKISSYIFIITPNNIELSGDFTNVLSSVTGRNLRIDE